MTYIRADQSPRYVSSDDAVRRYCRGVLSLICLLLLLLPAICHADSPVVSATPVAMQPPTSALSSDELGAAAARGIPLGTPNRVPAPAPVVRLWDEIGTPQVLPSQGVVSITVTGGRTAP